MRISVKYYSSILFFLLIVIPTGLLGQEELLNKTITVNYRETPLSEVLEDINIQTGIEFSYSRQKIPADFKVNYSASKKTESILKDIFKQAGIEYTIVGGYLVLQKSIPDEKETKKQLPHRFTISGTITDNETKEILIGAAIYNKATGTGTLSNKYGFFSLSLPEGNYIIEISYLGYKVVNFPVELNKNIVKNTELEIAASVMEEIVISSVDKEEIVFTSLAAQNTLRPFEVQQQSAALGETDMLKSLNSLPGISFHNDGSSYFYVRGGNRDQNLILLDEAPIYNPSHLLGLFTPIIPEAVKHTEVYKADFPIQYGGRLSSIIDMRTKDGNMEKFSGGGNIGLISTRINFEGPFKKNTSSYFVSYRRSHLGMYIKALNPSIEDFYFNDFNAKLNIKVSDKNRLFLTLYTGKDFFINKGANKKDGLEWGNNSLTLRWNHIFGNRLFSNTTFYTSKYDYFLYNDYDNKIYWNSHISSASLKSEFTFFVKPEIQSKFGVNFNGYFFNPGNYNAPEISPLNRVSEVNSGELILYAGNEHEIIGGVLLNYGLRLVNWSDYGEAFSVIYDENYDPVDYQSYAKGENYYSYNSLEPRISASIKTGEFTSVKLSYNKTIQHINLINNSISPFNSLEVWLPSGPNIKPQHAHIVDFGLMHYIPEKTIELQADIFYKKMFNQIGYKYHAEMMLNPLLEGEIRQGNGKAFGFEFLLKKAKGRFNYQLSYAYIRSLLHINGLNGNRVYPAHQDKPLDFSLLVNYAINPRWNINAGLHISSGMRITTPTGFYDYRGTQVPIYTRQDNQRLPNYKRFDIGTTIRLNKSANRFDHFLNIVFYNFFGIQNPAFLNFNKVINNNGKILVPADNMNEYEIVPTYRFIYSIVPSINYSLKF